MDRREFLRRAGLGVASAPFLMEARRRRKRRGPNNSGQPTPRNVLLILTDDQDPASAMNMPKTVSRMMDYGARFPNGSVAVPQCGPSRVCLFTGRYAHNHGCLDHSGPDETYGQFIARGHHRDNLPVWLQNAGVKTAMMGKYLNGYGNGETHRYVPPGWDRFIGWQGGYQEHGKDEWRVNDMGEVETFDRREVHDTDWFSDRADAFVRVNRVLDRPWFLMVSLNAPHSASYSAPRHDGMFGDARMPRPPSFDEADVSDKPARIRARDRLSPEQEAEAQGQWRQRLRALQSVDDMVARLCTALHETGQADDTMVVYTSDNGFMLWRHRIETKGVPYNESMGVPFMVRGPGVEPGRIRPELVSNVDLAPTICEWTGTPVPDSVDGRSFAGLFSGEPLPWREHQLVEFYNGNLDVAGVRTADNRLYVEHQTGEKEYYEMASDPYQLDSKHEKLENGAEMADLSERLRELRSCSGDSCRLAEGLPTP